MNIPYVMKKCTVCGKWLVARIRYKKMEKIIKKLTKIT